MHKGTADCMRDSTYQATEPTAHALATEADQDLTLLCKSRGMHFAGGMALNMQAECFGVTVTRRPEAKPENLTAYELHRALDVLVHVRDNLQLQSEPAEVRECEFPMWVVSSDSRDAQPRVVWLVFRMDRAHGRCQISLSAG